MHRGSLPGGDGLKTERPAETHARHTRDHKEQLSLLSIRKPVPTRLLPPLRCRGGRRCGTPVDCFGEEIAIRKLFFPRNRRACRWLPLVAATVLGGACARTLSAQTASPRPWQDLQMSSVADLRAHWLAPPAEYGPEPYYGMNGPVSLETIQRDFDTIRSLGFHAVTIQYGFGSERPYLSQEYLQFFRSVVLEARKRDLRLWIVDDAGYPSGFAGGKFSSEFPNLRMQALTAFSRTPLPAGELFEQTVPSDTVAVDAVNAADGHSVMIPVENGAVHWRAPEGSWTVYVVGHTFRTSPTRSDTNPKRVKDGSQSLEDYLDPAATAQFLRSTHEAYKAVVGDAFGKTILGFRGDEPDYSIAGLPWTPAFFDTFLRSKGYDVRPYLGALLQPREVTLTEEQLRAKADVYDVFAGLFRDGFFRPQAEWCAQNGLEYQVHLNHEEQELALARSEGDFFRDMRFVQVPGIDTIWHQIWTDTVSDFPRLASSAAHVYGHPRSFTESFAAYRPLPDVTMARYILNEQFARGINLVEAMYFPATSTPGHGGPMPFMRDAAFPALMRYTSRLSYALSMGRPDAGVGLLLPSEALWMGDSRADATFVSMERLFSEHQIDFDAVDEDALATLLPMQHGSFVTKSGNRLRTIVIPPVQILPALLASRLRSFSEQGGRVLFLGQVPARVAEHNDLQARPSRPGEFAWAQVVPADLPPVPTPPMQPPAEALGAMIVPPTLLTAVQRAVPAQSFRVQAGNTALRVTHRVLRDGDLFFLFNESAQAVDEEAIVHSRGKTLEAWDADTGTTQPVNARQAAGALRMHLQLPPYGAQLLVVH